jgi:hypothetical protein
MATKSATVLAAHLTSAPLKETINQELYAVIGDSQPSLTLVHPLRLTDKRPTKKWLVHLLGLVSVLIDLSVGGSHMWLGHRRERKFVHQGRRDELQLSHWVTVDENSEEEDKGMLFLASCPAQSEVIMARGVSFREIQYAYHNL